MLQTLDLLYRMKLFSFWTLYLHSKYISRAVFTDILNNEEYKWGKTLYNNCILHVEG